MSQSNSAESYALLTATGVTKRYGNVTVLNDVSLDVRRGEVHALLGANGAGKSTLCKVISGLIRSDASTMQLAGQPYAPGDKQAAESVGVQIVQQELNLIKTLSVAENIMLGVMPSTAGVIRREELHRRAAIALDRFGLADVDPDTIVGQLGVGRQQMVEIASALDRDCRLLILDEPTAALTAGETARLFDQIARLKANGVGIIYISHRLDEVTTISDRVTVLRDGKYVCTRDTESISTDEMVELMSGENTASFHSFVSYATSKPAIAIRGLSGGIVNDVSFSVRIGERVGIAGLVGSGRTELLRLIFGADRATSGDVAIAAADVGLRFRHPREAVAHGLAMVTEDRKQNGLLLSQSIRVNTTLVALAKRFSLGGLLRQSGEHRATTDMVDSMETRCNDIEQLVGTLSGGNQQKVAVSKWLVRDADVYLFDEPTRGIDVPARRRIYRLFESLAQSGKAMVIVSSDLGELFETCDRILVMSAGRLVAEFGRDSWSTEEIMRASFSGYTSKAPTV